MAYIDVNKDTRRVLRKALRLIENGWTRKVQSQSGRYCASGAICKAATGRASGLGVEVSAATEALRSVIDRSRRSRGRRARSERRWSPRSAGPSAN